MPRVARAEAALRAGPAPGISKQEWAADRTTWLTTSSPLLYPDPYLTLEDWMKKLTLNVDDLRVASFETEEQREAEAVAMISGQACITRPTVYGTCCTP